MALPATDPETRLLSLVSGAEGRFLRAVLAAVAAAKSDVTVQDVIRLFQAGTSPLEVQRISDRIALAISKEYARSFFNTGNSTSDFIEDAVQQAVAFNGTAAGSVMAQENARSRIRVTMFEAQSEATREAVEYALTRGTSQRRSAKLIKDSIGLNGAQQKATNSYRDALEQGSRSALNRELRDKRFDRTVERSIKDGKRLTQVQIDRMVNAYNSKQLTSRAKTIARSEAQQSVNTANAEAYQQAIDSGVLRPEQIQRVWRSKEDLRVRASHQHLDGMERGVGEPFPGLISDVRYPGDPAAAPGETINCRCVLETKIVPLTNL